MTAPAVAEAVTYLRGKPIERLLRAARDRYIRRGNLRCSVEVTGAEKEALRGLFAPRVVPASSGRLRLDRFSKALEETRFGVGLVETLEAYFEEPIVTRQTKEAAQRAAWAELRQELERAASKTARKGGLLAWLGEQESYLRSEWRRQTDAFERGVRIAMRAFSLAREHPGLRLPVLANRAGRDPHALDLQRGGQMPRAARYLRSMLRSVHPDIAGRSRPAAEEWAELLEAEDIYLDDISSNVVTAGLVGTPPLIRAAAEAGDVLSITGRNLEAWKGGRIEAPGGAAYLVENPSAFSDLHEALAGRPPQDRPALVCTSGHLSLAARQLLDRLVDAGTTLRYSGDLDLEGVRIARFLRARYGEALQFWCMDPATYAELIRHTGREVSGDANLGGLSSLDRLIAEHGPIYQEAFIGRLEESLTR